MAHLALCIGGAPSVWSDLEAAKALVGDRAHVVLVTNHAGRFYEGDIDAWVTLHPELFEHWRGDRAVKGLNTDYRALAFASHRRLPGVEPYKQTWGLSSGLFAAQLALEAMACAGVILCGVPLEVEAGHFHNPGPWLLADRYRQGAIDAKAAGAPVRSMAGWTAELFGRPDADWLKSLRLNRQPSRQRQRRAPEAIMRVKFKRDRNWTPPEERRITIAYKAGWEGTIKRAWGEQMRDDGDLDEVASPARDPLDHDANGRKGGAKKSADA